MFDAKLEDEMGRIAALKRYELLDTAREEPFDRITGLVKTVLNVPIAVISLVDSDRQWFKSCIGMETSETGRDVSFCTHTIQARVPMVIPDAALDARFAESPLVIGPPYIRSYLGIPLATPDGYNIGSLCAIDVKPRNFDAGQIEVLKSFAALAIDEMELRRIAQMDHLTGALTRRGFCLEADKAISRFVRHHQPSILLMFDIDHFKQMNDTHGHAAGDIVLRTACATMMRLLRTSDVLGRLGGEEFGMVITDTGLGNAYECAERFRKALESLVIEHDPPLQVTASFGIAVVDEDCRSAEQWLAKVDEALYAAKRTGRNRSCFSQRSGILPPSE